MPMIGDEPFAIDERAGPGRRFGGRLERIPDHPGIDRALLEGGARIGGRQELGLDVLIGDLSLFERLDQKIMDIRALVQGDLLALEIADRLDRAVLRHQDRLTARRRRLMRHIDEGRAGGLREDRRRLAGRAEIDGAHIQPLEELRSRRELGPAYAVAQGFERLFERALAFEQDERPIFLDADADRLGISPHRP